jgi:hypothetical protein
VYTEGGQPLVSYILPSLLFDDATIEKPSGEISKPPITGNPLLQKR